MKKLLFLSLVTLIYSCNTDNPNNNNNKVIENDTVAMVNPDVKETETAPIEIIQENTVAIEDIPKKWYKLNLQESKQYTVNEWCEIQTTTIEIEHSNSQGWQIIVSYPTDSKQFKIIGFEASKNSNDFETIISGHFIIENPEYPDMDPEIYSFSWNKGMMYATFGGFFENDTRMVSKLNKEHYELIVENCDYLDEDQER